VLSLWANQSLTALVVTVGPASGRKRYPWRSKNPRESRALTEGIATRISFDPGFSGTNFEAAQDALDLRGELFE